MISINREKGYIVISRCDYLYRTGRLNTKDYKRISDGDIVIPLPEHMISDRYDHNGNTDGQNAVEIIEYIAKQLRKKGRK
jgi:hypothetical protein